MSAAAERNVRTVCPYCGVGCGMILKVREGKVVQVLGDKEHPANYGKLCTKGATCAQTLQTEDRLAQAWLRPHRAEAPRPAPLEEALRTVADRFSDIIGRHGPDAVAFYVSGQLSMESQYLANKLCKGFIGTNNIDSNSRLCMASAAGGYRLSLGADGPPGSYEDFEKASCFLVIGANMAECHPILYLRLLEARRKSGAKLIVVDPRRTATADKADLYLPIAPGTDLAFLNGLLYLLVEEGAIDEDFIRRHGEGWEEMPEFLKAYPPAYVARVTGLPEADLIRAALWIAEAPELMSLWTMGLNQSSHGTWQTNALCNLHLATGKICRPGSGPFSLTGQPNAMGGREVGYMSHALPGQRVVAEEKDRSFMEDLWGLPAGAIGAKAGLDAVSLFQKMEAGEIKAVWIIGSNPAVTMPRRSRVQKALERAEFVVVQDAYHPTETSRYADVLLPGAVWAEAEGTMVNSERRVSLMQKALEPPGAALPDWEIITRVARYLGHAAAFPYRRAADVFEEIGRTANAMTGYDLRGIDYGRLRGGPLQWPCGPGESAGRPIRYQIDSSPVGEAAPLLRFPTASGKARFFVRPFLPPAEMPDADFPFVLTTGRVANQWHTMTKTRHVAALNKLDPGPFLEIHPEDAAALGAVEGDGIEIRSRRGHAILPARITDRIRPGCCFAPFHWNDRFGEDLSINAVTNEAVDPLSKQPEFKYCAVQLAGVARVKFSQAPSSAWRVPGHGVQRVPAAPERGGDPVFTREQKRYLEQLLSDALPSPSLGLPLQEGIPEDAPFPSSDRLWIDGLFSSYSVPASPGVRQSAGG